MSAPALPDSNAAVFLDFDGTLAKIAETPASVVLHADVPPLLRRLRAALDGAVAIVSGRPIDDLDRHLGMPELATAGLHGAEQAMQALCDQLPGMALLRGNCVIELKPAAARKDLALQALMAVPPFLGRLPWFFGDDVTDEDGFVAIAARQGVAVKIGPCPTRAAFRLDDVPALHRWLAAAADRLDAGHAA